VRDAGIATTVMLGLSGFRVLAMSEHDGKCRPATARLDRGQRFHREVQTAFLAGLVAADAHPEQTLALRTGRRRVDLLVFPQTAGEVTAVVVEIKNSDWDAFPVDRVRPNLRRHIRQLQEYLDHYVEYLRHPPDRTGDHAHLGGIPLAWDSVIGVLLYPKRPSDPARGKLIEDEALQQALAWSGTTKPTGQVHMADESHTRSRRVEPALGPSTLRGQAQCRHLSVTSRKHLKFDSESGRSALLARPSASCGSGCLRDYDAAAKAHAGAWHG
jgi:hypothetical protein